MIHESFRFVASGQRLSRGPGEFAFQVPLGMAGTSAMIQAVSLAPSVNQGNVFFTTTNAHEIRFL